MSQLPLLVFMVVAIALMAGVLGLAWLIGARTRRSAATDMPYESGILPVGEAGQLRLAVEFYVIAIFFVIFDLEAVYVFSWAVAFEQLGWTGYLAVSLFILELLLALVYAARSGLFQFGDRQREPSRRDSLG